MAYAVNQDESSQTSWWATQWSSIISGSTWEESLSAWKLSNVMGGYISNYGALKTQLMIGFERKINMLYKYEWYMTKPTKVLLNGEGKIDLEKISKTTPWYNHAGLMFTSLGSTHTVETLEKGVKAAAEEKRIAGGTTETHGTHTMNVTLGNSTESIAVGAKVIEAPLGDVRIAGLGGVTLMQSEASWLEVTAAGCTVNAPIINLG
ncbi:MAG: hypothetical protein EBS51_12670 [Planctomycetia bacterium]|nr:hypothetical protein [Planctomycetia bacterium]